MTDVMGTAGGTRSSDNDLNLIYQGGDNFLSRMKALNDAKYEFESALSALNLGKNVKQQLEETKKLREEAAKRHAEAEAVLAKAKVDAAAIVAESAKNSESARVSATDEYNRIVADAGKIKSGAEGYAASSKVAADAIKAAAIKEGQHAEAARLASERSAKNHDNAEAAAKQVQKDAETLHAKLQDKIKRLHSVIQEISAQ